MEPLFLCFATQAVVWKYIGLKLQVCNLGGEAIGWVAEGDFEGVETIE